MKRTLSLFFLPLLSVIFSGVTFAQLSDAQLAVVAQPPVRPEVVHIATALNHLTVLEFGEPVTQAAAGSSAFTIEWRDNKVLIKPLKPGVSTDLFVWTSSRRFTYELDPPGEVKNMSFAIDNPSAEPKPAPITPILITKEEQMTHVADVVLTRALLGADRINNSHIRNDQGRIIVRIENVFQSSNSLYVRYSIQNLTGRPYRVVDPAASEIVPPDNTLSLSSLRRTQLDDRTAKKLGARKRTPLVLAIADIAIEDVRPGEETTGVIVLRKQFSAPAVLNLVFPDAGGRHVAATFVY